jgi:gliding motility-associated-like protein
MHSCSLPPSTVTVTLLPRPAITKTPDTALCNNTASVQLFAAGGNTYSWSPAATLNNPAIANPIATPLLPVTKYYVVVTNTGINGCTSKDSIIVTRKPLPAFGVLPSKSTCQGTAVQLNATGGDVYLWSPATAVTNANISNPFTTTSATTFYRVTITESTCNISQTLATTVTINPTPVVSAIKSNDIDCSIDFAKLLADGAAQYIWTPSKGLSSYTIYNPIAKPDTTTQYIVKGFNSYGCSASDTLTVAVTMLGKSGYYMPNSFTPNGDGKNDCFGIKYWGIVQQLQFIIYNRWGEKVFASSDPNACWDGNYKSAKADGGSYVYYIKAITACGPVEKKGNVLLIR